MRALALILLVAACGPSDKAGGACKDTIGPGDLVITEVFADFKAPSGSSGADTGKEWFEVYNATDRPVELEGLTITHSRPDGSKPNTHVMTTVTVAPGQYYTLGDATQDLVPAYVDYGYGADLGDFYNSDGGKLALSCGDTEIDHATYEAVKEGHSRELTAAQAPDYTANDDIASWCQADDTEFDSGNFGTPGSDNDCVPVVVGQCNDNGAMRATMPPVVGSLVITELMPKPKSVSATVGQWFEVKALTDVDLNGLGLDRANDNGVAPKVVDSPDCIHLAAGDFAVFARSADMAVNGGIAAAGVFAFSLNPTSNADVQIVYGGTTIDAVTWTTSTSGKSLQLDSDFTDPTSNDDPSNFCDGSMIYNTTANGSDLGTPRSENAMCAATVGPGQCLDGATVRSIVPPAVGQLVITEFMANPAGTGTDSTQEWFEVLNSGAASFDLNELTIKGNTTSSTVHATECKKVAAGGYALFAHTADATQNGGLPDVDATFTTALAQSNGSLSVIDAGANVIDAITWTTGIVDGSARELNPANLSATDNDLPANFCTALASQTYGTAGNLGTPKAVNACM